MSQSSPSKSHDRPLVQWSFLQYKRQQKSNGSNNGGSAATPIASFLHSATQIGSKILIFGGSDANGEAQRQLLIYDTQTYQWSSPANDLTNFEENHPGARYGHTGTLIEMHPPKVLIYGGMIGGGTFEFDIPDGVDPDDNSHNSNRELMSWRRKGKKSLMTEETDEAVYILTLNSENWTWSKPLIHTKQENNSPLPKGSSNHKFKPIGRTEHTACKTNTNEVTIFGGWANKPLNDIWTFNYIDMEWTEVITSGIQPRPRYRHTCEVVGNRMFILGGSDNIDDVAESSKYLGIHQLSLDTMQWTHPTIAGISDANPFPRSGHSSAVIGAQTLVIFGGKRNNQIYLNDLILIDLETFVATRVNVMEQYLPTPVANCSLTTIGNKCFVFGGTDVKGVCFNDIRSVDVGYYLNANDITVGEGASSDYCFKLLIIGDSAVGKSALLTRFSENAFLSNYTSTIGIDFNSRMIRVDHAICKLEIWDTAGQERFSTITANYYRGAQGALLVYDVSREDSFDHVKSWYERAKQLGGEDMETILVGNKNDLPFHNRQVTTSDGEELAAQLGIPFAETSALSGANVESAFVCMTLNIKKSVDRRGLNGIKSNNLKKAGGVQLANSEKRSSCMGCNNG
eukprot:gene13598-18252_t